MSEEFTVLCALADIPAGGCRGFSEQRLFAVRSSAGDRVFIYNNQCPHLGIPLEWVEHQFLDPSGSMIQCANHAALFVIDSGQCVSGPCAGQKLTAIPCRIEGNNILIRRVVSTVNNA
ncbi:Rieske (2Fe-2S) protein [Cellvibrio japonicus]|uniref:Iron-sulfur cluster-binding protein, Rieske family n=1 Tax=Cellvibrio japonicus (strain Ueda107) TaxID=498211 RepID=B3PJ04_CELJU|nr:Rieske (2Fe-2S) protein [Cellvibrio japonicus]ACE85002.1 iron-sulfur cluster-binding protein, Rieske family [Cellvibrio japonicus Ueda107]QEI11206.1 Rieske (2Fe-2S) protein [Cellvibrio japonicus]QEI14780.1 Rieske (2Fe-2S) protein [Cellvibrio japonicus]QEI18360.1 Rieske (2Fe-2S) protein [Cellvibrio japonicus]